MAKYFVRFKSKTDTLSAFAAIAPISPEHDRPYHSQREPDLLIADLGREEVESARQAGGLVYPDVRFSVFQPLYLRRGQGWQYWEHPRQARAASVRTFAPEPVVTTPLLSLADVLT